VITLSDTPKSVKQVDRVGRIELRTCTCACAAARVNEGWRTVVLVISGRITAAAKLIVYIGQIGTGTFGLSAVYSGRAARGGCW